MIWDGFINPESTSGVGICIGGAPNWVVCLWFSF